MTNLGERELEILQALWDAGGEASVGEVLARLQEGGARVAYTTVQTMLNRLVEKGIAAREKRGRAFVYLPRLSVDSVSRDGVDATIDRFFNGSAEALAVHLVEHELDDEELVALQRLIDRRRKGDP